MTRIWRSVETNPPPQNVEVDTMSPGGMQQTLKLRGNLWWFPDDRMYCYYTPSFWIELDPGNPAPAESRSR